MDKAPQAHVLYSKYVENGQDEIAKVLWGSIPETIGDAYPLLEGIRKAYGQTPDALEDLIKVIRDNMRRLGILTSHVSKNIDRLGYGVIETGQQPYALGGSSLILNKIAYISSLSNIGENDYTPLFFIADYDGIHAELLNIRVPSPSPRGLLFSYPIGPEYENVPIYKLPNPPEKWLEKAIESLRGNYRGLLRTTEGIVKERALLNLDHSITILKNAYFSTEYVSDWATKTIGIIINLESDLGIPFFPFSIAGSRSLFQSGYELLLSDINREKFIDASNQAAMLVESAGYRAGIGLREYDYVPFFLECLESRCKGSRVELKYYRSTGSSTASISGKCSICNEKYNYVFNAANPDLSEIIENITPRVDTRQVVVDSVVPVLAHVGGPGETSYYAEVIPAAKALELPFPIFMRYTRLFYNTPWNEVYSRDLEGQGNSSINDSRIFEALRIWVEARNNSDSTKLKEAHILIKSCIESTAEELEKTLVGLNEEIREIKQKLRKPENRQELIKEMRKKQAQSQKIELYMSSALGRFSQERFGQEVSWAWFDIASVAGVRDLMGVFLRQYNAHTPNSSMFYANL
jgi:hypothetical protein